MVVEDSDDDFTFPTTVAEERGVVVVDDGMAAMTPADVRLGDNNLPLPGSAAAPSRLWPFAAPLIGAATTAAAAAVKEEEEAEGKAPAASTRRESRDEEERATVFDEDRMDMLWDDAAAAAATKKPPAPTKSAVRSKPADHPASAAAKPAEEEMAYDERAAAVAEQERMDLLWESFNEELLLLRRARSNSKSGKQLAPGPPEPDWYLCPSSTSDAESEEASTAVSSPGRARYGCAPTMLRASSRAGGAGQFCSSPLRHRTRTRSRGAGGWALLLRLFRRLFAVDKAPQPRPHSVYVP